MLAAALRLRKWLQLPLILTALTLAVPPAHAVPMNGDFETGLVTPWLTFTSVNGTIGSPAVVSFDTTGSGASNAVQLNVGQVSFDATQTFEGGGILQEFTAATGGFLSGSADIASFKLPTPGLDPADDDNHGGLFELLIDGFVQASFNFGFVLANQTHRATMTFFNLAIGAGTHEISFGMRRPYLTDIGNPSSPTPRQYIDNVSLSITDTAAAVPEPGTSLLLGLGLFGLAALRHARHA